MGVAPQWMRELEERVVDERERLVMEAQLNPKLKPKPTADGIVWQRNDTALITGDRVRTEYDEASGVCRLVITSAELADSGRISISAKNEFGAVTTSASMGVRKRIAQTKPQFLSTLDSITVAEGDSLLAKVLINAEPKAQGRRREARRQHKNSARNRFSQVVYIGE